MKWIEMWAFIKTMEYFLKYGTAAVVVIALIAYTVYRMRFVKAHDFSRWDETKQKKILDFCIINIR